MKVCSRIWWVWLWWEFLKDWCFESSINHLQTNPLCNIDHKGLYPPPDPSWTWGCSYQSFLKIFLPRASLVTLTDPHFPVGWMASSCPFKIHLFTVFSCTLRRPETSLIESGSGDSSNLVFRSFMAFLSNGFKSFDSDCTVNRFARLIILDDDLIHFFLL